jgi:hypothetical protein
MTLFHAWPSSLCHWWSESESSTNTFMTPPHSKCCRHAEVGYARCSSISMSSSKFFDGGKADFPASLRSSRWLWNGPHPPQLNYTHKEVSNFYSSHILHCSDDMVKQTNSRKPTPCADVTNTTNSDTCESSLPKDHVPAQGTNYVTVIKLIQLWQLLILLPWKIYMLMLISNWIQLWLCQETFAFI